MYRHGGLEFERSGSTLVVRVQDGTTENAPVVRTVVFDPKQLSDLTTEINLGTNPFLPKKLKKDKVQPVVTVEEGNSEDVDDIVAKMLAK